MNQQKGSEARGEPSLSACRNPALPRMDVVNAALLECDQAGAPAKLLPGAAAGTSGRWI